MATKIRPINLHTTVDTHIQGLIDSDYIRGIPKYLSKKDNAHIVDSFLMKNSANPLNHTACYKISLDKENSKISSKPIKFVCPYTKTSLEKRNEYYYSQASKKAFSIIEGIPNFDPRYSLFLSSLDNLN